MTILLLFLPKDSNHGPNAENTYEIDVHDENTTTLCEEQSPVSNLDNNGINTEVIDEINIHEPPKKKTRIEEKYLKDHGMEYNNPKGVTIPQNKFKELINCCCRKCDIVCPPDKQKIIFEGFYKLEKEIQYQIMSCGITLIDKKSTRLKERKMVTNMDHTICLKKFLKKTGYKFKKPKLDTCKTCDTFVLQIKQCKDIQQKILLQQHETHKKLADIGYIQKKEDKINALASNNIRVLVFHLEQVLDTPALCTNVSFYKRLLSTFNLTIRDCSENEGTECYMWHEAIGGRGSNEIASCLYQKILNLLNNVTHIITYSDKCGGQNRNINMAAMLSLVTANSSTLHIIDQKFLLPGHTHLECDVDHTKIERAKKFSDIPIMIPRDWYQFVRTVKGLKPFKVIEMKQEQFFSFSNLVSTSLTKKTVDTDGNKVNWFHIRWIRYEKVYGKLQFKYSLNLEEPFRVLDLTQRPKRGRPKNITVLTNCYKSPLPINPQKKQDLLSLLPLIHEDCHSFNQNLKTSKDAAELPLINSDFSSDEG
ncbi:hypothetical protein QTP88_011199 [Uroleucon formosanum]